MMQSVNQRLENVPYLASAAYLSVCLHVTIFQFPDGQHEQSENAHNNIRTQKRLCFFSIKRGDYR